MSGFFDTISYALSHTFVLYALAVGALIALCSSLFGATLVLKRYSFIGDGLSHVAFGATAVAAVLSLTNNTYFVLGMTVLCAVLILKAGRNATIKGDAAIAMTSVGALALGYILINLSGKSANVAGDVCSALFGSTSILTLTRGDVILSAVLSLLVIVLFILLYDRFFAVTFDEDFAAATGMRASLYNLITAVTVAVIIVLGMKLVGSLLISALLIFPALSAMRLFKSYLAVTLCAAVISVLCAVSGLLISIAAATPAGSTVVAADIAAFGVCSAVGSLKKR